MPDFGADYHLARELEIHLADRKGSTFAFVKEIWGQENLLKLSLGCNLQPRQGSTELYDSVIVRFSTSMLFDLA